MLMGVVTPTWPIWFHPAENYVMLEKNQSDILKACSQILNKEDLHTSCVIGIIKYLLINKWVMLSFVINLCQIIMRSLSIHRICMNYGNISLITHLS